MWQYDPNVGDMVWVEPVSAAPTGPTIQQNLIGSFQGYGAEGGEMSFNPDGTFTISTPLADNQFLNTVVDSSGQQLSQNVSSGKEDYGIPDLLKLGAFAVGANALGAGLGQPSMFSAGPAGSLTAGITPEAIAASEAALPGVGAGADALVGGIVPVTPAVTEIAASAPSLTSGITPEAIAASEAALPTEAAITPSLTEGITPADIAASEAALPSSGLLSAANLKDLAQILGVLSFTGLLSGSSFGGGGGTQQRSFVSPTATVPMGNADYYNAVQQYYNTYMPQTPRDVATPLQQWYEGKFGG